jgi:Flp pilus assembly protein TadG
MKRSSRNDAGSAFVELALVLPLLCLVLIGAVELGRMAYAAIEVSNAARAAVAYGSQNLVTATDSPDMKTVAAADASDLTAMGATLLTTPSTVCVCDDGSSSPPAVGCSVLAQQCCPTGETANCTSGYHTGTGVVYVKAATTATVKTIFNYPGIPNSFTLHGFAQMRVLQD